MPQDRRPLQVINSVLYKVLCSYQELFESKLTSLLSSVDHVIFVQRCSRTRFSPQTVHCVHVLRNNKTELLEKKEGRRSRATNRRGVIYFNICTNSYVGSF